MLRAQLRKPAATICLECHAPNGPNGPHVAKLEDHTRHKTDSAGSQCVTCHMPKHDAPIGQLPGAAVMNHTFAATTYEACVECHGSAANAEGLVDALSGLIAGQIQDVKSALDRWAATKAPASLYATYGTRAWEYTTPGDLSPGGAGPSSAEQALIPDNIKRARFNLYLVLYDGSHGVHNGPHSSTLLGAAQNWVEQELNP